MSLQMRYLMFLILIKTVFSHNEIRLVNNPRKALIIKQNIFH